jgi:hypothetical protein
MYIYIYIEREREREREREANQSMHGAVDIELMECQSRSKVVYVNAAVYLIR